MPRPITDRPVRIALIGAGIFARDAHLPALLALGDTVQIVAIYSRNIENADALATNIPYPVETTSDAAALYARDDIDALDLLLPIEALPDAIHDAFASGKHILSEKPIAPDIATARELITLAQQHPDQTWMVGENWRYEAAFRKAAARIADGAIGRPLLCTWAQHIAMTPDNKYYATDWRRSGTFPGGFLLDGGVHHAAALRMIMGEITEVSAFTAQMRPDLPPADTLSAALRFENGALGHYTVTYAPSRPTPTMLHIVGEQGDIMVDRTSVKVRTEGNQTSESFPDSKTVHAEIAEFIAVLREGTSLYNTPQMAFADLAVIEGMLDSAQTGRAVSVARYEDAR